LYYYRARYYNPSIGRFVSEDPIKFGGGMNFYTYVADSPTTMIDPWGLQHTPGGPWHPEPWIIFRCSWDDDCATLSRKIQIFKDVLYEHLAWVILHPNSPNDHKKDIE